MIKQIEWQADGDKLISVFREQRRSMKFLRLSPQSIFSEFMYNRRSVVSKQQMLQAEQQIVFEQRKEEPGWSLRRGGRHANRQGTEEVMMEKREWRRVWSK